MIKIILYYINIFGESMNNIKNILSLYGLNDAKISLIKYKSSEKERAVYKIKSTAHSYCLKQIYYSEEELLFVYSALEWLNSYNLNVTRFLKNSDSGRYINYDGVLYILTDWIDGVKCDSNIESHLSYAIKEIAKFHLCSKDFLPIDKSLNRCRFTDLYISTLKHIERLFEYKNKATKKNDVFSKIFLNDFEQSIKLSEISLKISALIKPKLLSKSLCHGDFVTRNILIKDTDVWFIDFDNCKYSYSAYDISYFLRRILGRRNFDLNVNNIISLLCDYNSVSLLGKDDLMYIVSYIIFPQKLFKISKHYYYDKKKISKKQCIDSIKRYSKGLKFRLDLAEKLVDYFEMKDWKM